MSALGRGSHCDPGWKNQDAQCDSSLSVVHHSMAAHVTKYGCEGVYPSWYIVE